MPIGTSFAVRCPSLNKLLTAHHLFTQKVIVRDPTGREVRSYCRRTPNERYVVIRCMMRNVDGTESIDGTVIPVRWIAGDAKKDWAVLERTDGIQFSMDDDATFPICAVIDLPVVELEPVVKIYHCNVSAYTDPDPRSDLLSIEVTPRSVVSQRSRHTLNLPHGVFSGSSGGAVVDYLGRVVGILIGSWSPISVTYITEDMSQEQKDSVSNSNASSIVNSYGTYALSIIPSTFPELLAALQPQI